MSHVQHHLRKFVSDIAVFVLKRDVKLQLTHLRKFCFINRMVNTRNSLPNLFVSADTTNAFNKFRVSLNTAHQHKSVSYHL